MGLPVVGCATPVVQKELTVSAQVHPQLLPEQNAFIAHDGARLGLTVWPAHEPSLGADHVVIAVHGMNDYANSFYMAAPYWAEHGVTTYAYDHRGFGRSPNKGIWPEEELMRQDLRTLSALVRAKHPDATITLVGVSMGAALSITTLASDDPPDVDRFIASGPGLRGWGALNPLYSSSLWVSAHVRPAWIVRPPRRLVHIEPSDNDNMLREIWSDPHMTFENRIDQVIGVVSLMENAHDQLHSLPEDLPILFTYGANDYVIPSGAVKRSARKLPSHAQTAYYENGYHMLLRDIQAETVHQDYLSFMLNPEHPLPSAAPEWPWRETNS